MLYLVAGASGERDDKQFSIFQVIKFPNDACIGAGSLNGTCYTSTECTSLGGTSSGACASSFGVCCVFSLACGATTSQNGSYAIIDPFSTSTDTDPCTYKYCKINDDVCKLRWGKNFLSYSDHPVLIFLFHFCRIDFESMEIAGPNRDISNWEKGQFVGQCSTDSFTGREYTFTWYWYDTDLHL